MKIITDTGSLISQKQAEELDIELLPLQVAIAGKNYRDYFELASIDFVKMVKDAIPNSSQPAIGEVMEVYEKTKKAFEDYCECAGQKVIDSFTIAELEQLNKTPKDTALVKKLAPIIANCAAMLGKQLEQ